jgi:hypothetical protein
MEALENSSLSDELVCQALVTMATEYRVIRNFAVGKCDESVRLLSALQALRGLSPPSETSLVECVESFATKLQEKYGKRVISAASKILWMRFRSPVIIYDSLASECLAGKAGLARDPSYEDFCFAWRRAFEAEAPLIKEACKDLVQIKKFTLVSELGDSVLQDIVNKPWFMERVFDHALVNSSLTDRF